MKQFKFFKENKGYTLYREMVNTLIQEAIRWNVPWRHMVKPFYEDGIQKKISITNVNILYDNVEVNYQIELPTVPNPAHPDFSSVCIHYFVIPYDEYMDIIEGIVPFGTPQD